MPSATVMHRNVSLLFGVSVSLLATSARAHTIPGGLTLHDLCRSADVVAVARISYLAPAAPNAKTLPPVDAEVLELLRVGDARQGTIRFLPHRHAGEEYVVGEELLLFLERTRATEKQAEAPYEAIEAVGERLVLPADRRSEWIDAAKQYVALGKGARNTTDPRALGRVSIAMLASPDEKLAMMAMRDVTLSGAAPVITNEDAPALLKIVENATHPAMLRVGLLTEIERRKITPIVGARWVALLDSAPTNQRSAVISGAKSRWFVPEVNARLVSIVRQGKPDEAISAARAVGGEGNEGAVDALAEAVTKEPAELRFAALASLRRINSQPARDKLAAFAASHPDPETRKAATMERGLLPPAPVPAKSEMKNAAETNSMSNRSRWFVFGALLLVFVVMVSRTYGRRAEG